MLIIFETYICVNSKAPIYKLQNFIQIAITSVVQNRIDIKLQQFYSVFAQTDRHMHTGRQTDTQTDRHGHTNATEINLLLIERAIRW